MATAYRRIQNPGHYQVNQKEAEEVASEAIDAMQEAMQAKVGKGQELSTTQRRMKEVTGVLKNFVGIMGMKYQSTLDTRYTKFMKSSVSLATIMASELNKPEYSKRRYKTVAILKSATDALREVYLPHKTKK
jgi:hypothetical protein